MQDSNKERYILIAVAVAVLLLASIIFFPNFKMGRGPIGAITASNLEPLKTNKEYYNMFQCSCCGSPIDRNCCGMAKERKEYVDNLLLEGLEENEVVYQMVKRFGFDVLMDQSKEQEVRDYILSRAPDSPPRIEIENPVYDFGVVSQSDGVITTEFIVKSAGESDLIIENIDSSCMCTSASLIYKGEEGPRFSMAMHGTNPKNFELKIPPGETAVLKVYYDPNAHGRQKQPEVKIVREITVISNDPVDFQRKVRIELTQVQ